MPRKAAAANKRRASNEDENSTMLKRTKLNKSEESEGWEEYFNGDLLVYKKDMEGREKVNWWKYIFLLYGSFDVYMQQYDLAFNSSPKWLFNIHQFALFTDSWIWYG